MGWKGTLRSMQAAQRRAERESLRKQRELAKRRKQLETMQELQRAAYEVDVYNNYIDILLSVHKDCSDPWDWYAIKDSDPPDKPKKIPTKQIKAQAALDNYKPSITDKMLRRIESRRTELNTAIEIARKRDAADYASALSEYEKDYADWEKARALAGRIVASDPTAFLEAITELAPFSEIGELGSSIRIQTTKDAMIKASIAVNSEDVIPKEVKTLLKSGKLSTKNMPVGRFNELCQDYICACALRVAREILALLPIEMVFIDAVSDLLNTRTGHMEEQPILSIAIPRQTLARLNFQALDPSDSLNNFVHRMNFRKTKGFSAVEALTPSDLT